MNKLRHYSRRTKNPKQNWTVSLSLEIIKALDLRADKMGLSRSSQLETILRVQLRNEVLEIADS